MGLGTGRVSETIAPTTPAAIAPRALLFPPPGSWKCLQPHSPAVHVSGRSLRNLFSVLRTALKDPRDHQPPTTNRQSPTANRQSPPPIFEHMSYSQSFCKTAVLELFFSLSLRTTLCHGERTDTPLSAPGRLAGKWPQSAEAGHAKDVPPSYPMPPPPPRSPAFVAQLPAALQRVSHHSLQGVWWRSVSRAKGDWAARSLFSVPRGPD